MTDARKLSCGHEVGEWLHQKLAAAQNQPYEVGDTCPDCEELVQEELLPLLEQEIQTHVAAAIEYLCTKCNVSITDSESNPLTVDELKERLVSTCSGGWREYQRVRTSLERVRLEARLEEATLWGQEETPYSKDHEYHIEFDPHCEDCRLERISELESQLREAKGGGR